MGNALGQLLGVTGFGFICAVAAFSYLAWISVRLCLIDIRTHRLPNTIVLPAYGVAGVLLGLSSILGGEPSWLLRILLSALAAFTFYWLLWFIYPAGMGFGDVKLAGVLGLFLGFCGWTFLLLGIAAGFVVGGVWGLVLILSRKGSATSRIPFGPSMLVGAWLVMLLPL